jgi:class 3 adenylate cyclase
VPLDVQAAVSDGWAEIKPGHEHSFAFLFIEVDEAEELKKRHEPENLAGAMATFREFIERIVAQHGGRLWMWSRFGGLVLFPLHEPTPFAPLCGLRILLSCIFYDVEESLLPGRLSFRMALSIGSTVYHDGDTGRIVSDAVNSIFHLGRRFAQPGQFLLTADAHDLVPQQLRGFFQPAGTYEGRRIHRMLRPTSVTGMREAGSAWAG